MTNVIPPQTPAAPPAWTYPESFTTPPSASFFTRYRRPIAVTSLLLVIAVVVTAVILSATLDGGRTGYNELAVPEYGNDTGPVDNIDMDRDYVSDAPVSAPNRAYPFKHWHHIGSELIGPDSHSQYGYCVSISKDSSRLAVGVPQAENGKGMVKTYDLVLRNIYHWVELEPAIEGANRGDEVGSQVALSGDGSRLGVTGSGSGNGNGEVVVYEYGGGWNEMARTSGSKSGDILGMSLRFSEDGDSLVAGGAGGYLKVFRYDTTTSIWRNVAGVQSESDSDWVVGALDHSGSMMVVGFPLRDEVKVYDWMQTDQSWLQVGNTINATRQGDGFGQSVDISESGNTIVIGTDTGNYVQVFYYHHRRDIWAKHGSTIRGTPADKGLFGQVVSISNDGMRIAAGSPFYDTSGSHERGSVRVYDFIEEVDKWQMVGDNMEGLVDQSVWGFSVALSGDGNHVAVGAPGSDTTTVKAAGLVRVYELQEE
mmetsp:Transcript_35672/g.43675  ORF Transcript_35672/g.43675 Transcript_35672/m.43675 type:complete len:481 (-) Transcript_35672:96-1538(-)|eukprot:CAMPEP_0172499040 /NCGR_PEP_ID=MMETSP1066-20121228/121304_1 /TAXON_ID=671091 /ORGANISM="Coscinodiscus wailesii, Strain CCMP2513" /LENGTH=480 /DNA_ID=CAMNT_0013272581 /DNA_START=161 /DNA_END=1603 /DNA_ORIENTATION=-